METRTSSLLFFLLIVFISSCLCSLYTHTYVAKEEVILYADKVGPFRNPQETYDYYSLPFCPPEQNETQFEKIEEEIQGSEWKRTPYHIRFADDLRTAQICTKFLTKQDVEKFKHAVRNQYWYQFVFDELPIFGMVGEIVEDNTGDEKIFVFGHNKFSISKNGDRVIEANLTTENPQLVEVNQKIVFTYSVSWQDTKTEFKDRFQKYLDGNFFEHKVHWISLINSFMLVIFLVAIVSMILLRTLKNDYARYSRDDDNVEDRDVGDDSGWKQIHGDVFRPPPYLMIFSALYGIGQQLAVVISFVVIFAIFDPVYENKRLIKVFVILYAFSGFIAGYTGGGFYARNNGTNWIKVMLLSVVFYPAVCFIISIFLNSVAVSYSSLSYIPATSLFGFISLWLFVQFPLTVAGTVVGKNYNGTADSPCRIAPIPRPIPEKKWYLQPWVNIVLGGVLPFGSIFIEVYFVLTSFWHYKYYYVYGFMLLVYVILIIVSVCVTIVSTYFLLNSEDYRWQWVAFLSSASTAGYVFIYSIYYFFVKTKMSGFFQTTFYFGHTIMFCVGLAILCGSVGFIGTSVFVKRIYRNVKID